MIKINVRYSLKDEVEQVLDILGKVEWFQQNKYRFTLPSDLENFDRNKGGEARAVKIVEQVFDTKDYADWATIIQEGWKKIAESFSSRMLSLVNIDLKDKYTIILTKYGPGGGYNLGESSITLNIQLRNKDQIINSIVHEIVHLSIESLILKYKIEHWRKERIVDLIVLKLSIVESRLQRDPEDAEKIQELFDKLYPDVEKIISNIAK